MLKGQEKFGLEEQERRLSQREMEASLNKINAELNAFVGDIEKIESNKEKDVIMGNLLRVLGDSYADVSAKNAKLTLRISRGDSQESVLVVDTIRMITRMLEKMAGFEKKQLSRWIEGDADLMDEEEKEEYMERFKKHEKAIADFIQEFNMAREDYKLEREAKSKLKKALKALSLDLGSVKDSELDLFIDKYDSRNMRESDFRYRILESRYPSY